MEILTYNIKNLNNAVIFQFKLERNLEPSDLSLLKHPDPVKEGIATHLVILSGRGPIWLYAFMVHHFHPCKAIAIFDPGFNGGVVVETHTNDFKIGDVVKT